MYELHGSERNAVDRHVIERQRRDQRIHLAVGAERVIHAGIAPCDGIAGRGRAFLIEQVPGIGAAGRGAVDLGPAQLDVHRRTRHVIGS